MKFCVDLIEKSTNEFLNVNTRILSFEMNILS